MSNEKIRQLLIRLQAELQKTDLDAETHELMQELDADLHALTEDGDTPIDTDSVVAHAKSLQAKFASDHPVAERFVAEFISTLVKMGV